jgi:hypothetical protein
VVESTALEMRHTGNRIGGSNPSLSAIFPATGCTYSSNIIDQSAICVRHRLRSIADNHGKCW